VYESATVWMVRQGVGTRQGVRENISAAVIRVLVISATVITVAVVRLRSSVLRSLGLKS
jgi:hypothetical protein